MKLFVVDYKFLACGDVFTQGLLHAAATLGIEYQHSDWNVLDLPRKVAAFRPDLLFVVHGRKCIQRWQGHLSKHLSAVWLLDEPYEVDDTAKFSPRFSRVFVNDPVTIPRHAHASYLPVCYDPQVHWADARERPHAVGFIGGGNGTRDRHLAALAANGLLSYVIGGPWGDPRVQRLCKSRNIPAAQTPDWYRSTRIVVNVFREKHHYNRFNLPATSLNPRIYEALACGALVVSEWRPELDQAFPELPSFRSLDECVTVVRDLLADPARAEAIRQQCASRIGMHTYADRLRTVLDMMGLRDEAVA